MTFTFSQREFPYKHWEYKNLDTLDHLRIVPERGGLITSWVCNGQEILYLDKLIPELVVGACPICLQLKSR